jgi:hypothetical protein
MSKRSDSTVGADWQPVLPKITDEELMKRVHESDEQEEEILEPIKESGGESFFYRYRLPIAIIVILIICIVIYVYMTRQSEPEVNEVPPAALLNAQVRTRALSRAPPGPPKGIDRDELARLRDMRRQQRSQMQEREEESSDGEVEGASEDEAPMAGTPMAGAPMAGASMAGAPMAGAPTAIAPTAIAPTGPRVTFKQPLEAPPTARPPAATTALANTGESITDLISQTQSRPAIPGVTAAQLRTMRSQAPMREQAPSQAPMREQAPSQAPMRTQAPSQAPTPALTQQSPPRARSEMPTQLSMMHPLNAIEEAVVPAQDDEMDDLINSLGDAPQ